MSRILASFRQPASEEVVKVECPLFSPPFFTIEDVGRTRCALERVTQEGVAGEVAPQIGQPRIGQFLSQADLDSFKEMIDLWVLEYAEKYSAIE